MTYVAVGVGVAGLGVSAYGAWKGGKDKEKARDAMAKLNKPTYQIPQEIYDNLSDVEKRTVEGLPAQQKQEFVKNLERNQVRNLKSAQDRKSGLLGVQASTDKSNDAYTNLVSMDAAAKAANKAKKDRDLYAARQDMAQAKDRKFGVEKGDYNAQLASHQADYQAAAQSQHNAQMSMLNTGIGMGGAFAGSKVGNSVNGGNKKTGTEDTSKAGGMGAGTSSGFQSGNDWGSFFQ